MRLGKRIKRSIGRTRLMKEGNRLDWKKIKGRIIGCTTLDNSEIRRLDWEKNKGRSIG